MKIPSGSQRRGNEKVSARQQTAAMIAGEHLWGNHFVFDGVSRGWSTDELIPEGKERVALLPLPGHTEDRPNQVQATVRCTGSLDLKKFGKSIPIAILLSEDPTAIGIVSSED